MSNFLIGLLTGLFIASAFLGLFWKYFGTKKATAFPLVGVNKVVHEVIVTVTVIERTNTPWISGYRFELPIPWDRMVALAIHVVEHNYVFNYGLTGRESGNPLSRSEYDNMRDVFLKHGLLRERVPGNRRSGFEVTGPGRAYFRKWASLPPMSDDELIELSEAAEAQEHTEANVEISPSL
jgi:hypothetical protein